MVGVNKIIRSVGSDGKEVLSNILDKYSGLHIEYKEVYKYFDDSNMIDSYVDGIVYIKNNNKYYARSEFIDTGIVKTSWFGASSNLNDNSIIFNTILNKYNNIILDASSIYLCSNFSIDRDDVVFDFNNSIIKYNNINNTTNHMIYVKGNNIKFLNATIDTPEELSRGIIIYGDNFYTNHIKIFNSFYGIELLGDYFNADNIEGFNCTYSAFRTYHKSGQLYNNININNYKSIGYKYKGIVFNNKGYINNITIGDCYLFTDSEENASNGFLIDSDLPDDEYSIHTITINNLYNIGSQSGACKMQNVENVIINTFFDDIGNRVYPSSYGLVLPSVKSFICKKLTTGDRVSFYRSNYINIDYLSVGSRNSGSVELKGGSIDLTAIINTLTVTQRESSTYCIRWELIEGNHKVIINNANIPENMNLIGLLKDTITTDSIILGEGAKFPYGMVGPNISVRSSIRRSPRMFISQNAPTSGNWTNGDIIYKSSQNIINNNSSIGWVCIKGGNFDEDNIPIFNPFGVVNIDIDKRVSGSTSQRPEVSTLGYRYFDTTIGKVIYWSGSKWEILNQKAEINVRGLVSKSIKIDKVLSDDAVDLDTALILINELKKVLNNKLDADIKSGQMES